MRTPTSAIVRRQSHFHYMLSLVVAGFITIILVGQLFSFEDMTTAFAAVLPASMPSGFLIILPSFVVIFELAALAYFLPLYLSRLARWVSLAAAYVATIGWIVVSFAPVTEGRKAVLPLFGTKIDIDAWPLGLLFSFVLLGLVVCVTTLDLRRARLEKM